MKQSIIGDKKHRRESGTLFVGSLLILIFVIILSVSVGSADISLVKTVRILLGSAFGGNMTDIPSSDTIIIVSVRLPRVLLAGLIGAMLSVSGTAMQGLLRNPLADSSTLGVSSCAALGAVLAIATGFMANTLPYFGVAAASILFAFLSFFLIMAFAYKIDHNLSTNTIILMGIIVSMFASSIISFLVSISGDQMKNIIFWTMGSFSGRGWDYVLLVLPFAVVGVAGLMWYAGELDAFALGEEQARYFGVNVKKTKIMILIFISLCVGISVSVSGTIAFVGLVIPHICRMLIGTNHRRLLPFSVIVGAAFMILTDLISRTVLGSSELPVGVVTSLIGSVIFIYIFYTQRLKQK